MHVTAIYVNQLACSVTGFFGEKKGHRISNFFGCGHPVFQGNFCRD